MAAAAHGQEPEADSKDQRAAQLDKITQSHRRFLTMGGSFKARQYTRCPAASFECPMTTEFHAVDLTIPPELTGQRLDSALARLMPEHSRTRIKGWIEAGAIKVDRAVCKPRDIVQAGSPLRA